MDVQGKNSQSDEDITSLESYESFDDAYDRITNNTQNEKDVVLEHQETIDDEGKKAQISTGPVFHITEEVLQKGGGFHNVFNYNLRFNICPTSISKMMVVAMCFIVCVSVPTLVVTLLYEQPPSTTDAIDRTSPPALCTGRCVGTHYHPSFIFL